VPALSYLLKAQGKKFKEQKAGREKDNGLRFCSFLP